MTSVKTRGCMAATSMSNSLAFAFVSARASVFAKRGVGRGLIAVQDDGEGVARGRVLKGHSPFDAIGFTSNGQALICELADIVRLLHLGNRIHPRDHRIPSLSHLNAYCAEWASTPWTVRRAPFLAQGLS